MSAKNFLVPLTLAGARPTRQPGGPFGCPRLRDFRGCRFERSMATATLDFAPLLWSSIGFDQLPSLFAHALEGADRATFVLRFQGEKIQEDLTFALMTEGGNRPTKTPRALH